MRGWRTGVVVGLSIVTGCFAPAQAWTRPGHMVTAAIAYDEIARRHPELLDQLGALLDAHPDRGPFQVAMGRSTGPERTRRMFLECARWPDDARLTAYDHPTWHGALSTVSAGKGNAQSAEGRTVGEAFEAFALNFKQLSDTSASPGERALALCWVLHLAGDIHQPLHTAQLVSRDYPQGDHGGGLEYVRDPVDGSPITLHWLWDDSVNRSGEVSAVDGKAAELTSRFPRASLGELRLPTAADQFPQWARNESYPLAVSIAYRADFPAAKSPEAAKPPPEAYWKQLQEITARRVAVAGYRMADLVWLALNPAAN
jgi:hypothetical protein